MISVFDTEQLEGLLKDFYRIANIRITVFDSDLTELVSYPELCAPFCQIIRSSTEGRRACAECDRAACTAASKRTNAYIYRCHAGLTEAIMPLWVGNTLVGYLLFGHIFAYENDEAGWNIIEECCRHYPADKKELRAAISGCPHVTDEYILSAAHILHATASFLVMQRMATLQEGSIAAKLDAYLTENYDQPLTATMICQQLGIGRSRLYELSDQLYGCGISQQIRKLRIARAKQLLIDFPEYNISKIASECGYTDYNYFIAVFSRTCGLPPNAFRRQNYGRRS